MELCYDYLAPDGSGIGPPLDHVEDRVVRDRRILDVEAAASAWRGSNGRGLPLYQRCSYSRHFDPSMKQASGHDSCKVRAGINYSMSCPRESVSGPDSGHRPIEQVRNERKPQVISVTFLVYFFCGSFQINLLCRVTLIRLIKMIDNILIFTSTHS